MEIQNTSYASAYGVSSRRDETVEKNVTALTQDEQNSQQPAVSNTVTGLATSRLADSTVGTLIQQNQETNEVHRGDTTWFEKLNFVSESDRKLLSAMTGLNVDHIGRFTDNNGNAAFPEDLTQHTLRSFHMSLHGARKSGSPDAIAGENITEAEFLKLMDKSRAVVASMGEKFNDEYLVKGLEYIRGLG